MEGTAACHARFSELARADGECRDSLRQPAPATDETKPEQTRGEQRQRGGLWNSNVLCDGRHSAGEVSGTLERQPGNKGGGVLGIKPEVGIDTEHLEFAHSAGCEGKDRICGERCVEDESRSIPQVQVVGVRIADIGQLHAGEIRIPRSGLVDVTGSDGRINIIGYSRLYGKAKVEYCSIPSYCCYWQNDWRCARRQCLKTRIGK